MSQSLFMTLVVTLFTVSAMAKAKPQIKLSPLPAPQAYTFMSEQQYEKYMKEAKSGTRHVADIDKIDDVTALSDDLKNIRSALIGGPIWKDHQAKAETKPGVKTPDDLMALLNDLDGRYEQLETDAKFVAAQLIALKPFQSVIYRARHLIDNAELSKSAVIVMLRLSATGQNTFFPNEQWKAGFEFLTAPTAGMGPDIVSEEDLHAEIMNQVRPSVEKLYSRLNALSFSKPIYFDNKMAYATANFVSDNDRYVTLGETERIGTLAGLSLAISGMYTGLAYNWLGMFETADAVARVYGFRSTISSLIPGVDFVDGATAEKRTSVIKRNANLFTLRAGGEKWTAVSYDWFVNGVKMAKIAWAMVKKDGMGSTNLNNLIDPRGFLPFTRQIDSTLSGIESLIHGDGVSSSVVMGETVDVKFKDLFMNPPKDLKAFMPLTFDKGADVLPSKYARDSGGKLKGGYRNYLKGSPTAWCLKGCKDAKGNAVQSYQDYFPDVKSNEDVKRAARVLTQTWGGWLMGIPVGAMVF